MGAEAGLGKPVQVKQVQRVNTEHVSSIVAVNGRGATGEKPGEGRLQKYHVYFINLSDEAVYLPRGSH